ncbi:MAG TPA: heme-binding protein [Xanthobacteraceae bacterium]|jgi:glc operon protein GlcG|nr:heme-binding protein [Xanthobacteraceae bacterium]
MNTLKTMAVACAIALFAAVPGSAQQPPAYGGSITLEQAKKAMAAAEAEAAKNNWAMVIAIVDGAGYLSMLHRMDNASYGSIPNATGKAKTAYDYRQPTKNFNDRLTAGTAPHLLTIKDATFIEGGIPIVVAGKIVAAIGASGGTPPQDGQVAKAGADAIQ